MRFPFVLWSRWHRRGIWIAAGLVAVFVLLIVVPLGPSKDRYLSAELAQPALSLVKDLSLAEANRICDAHNLRTYRSTGRPRKIYDLILLSTELEWLEIRLHTLAAYVDYFVVVESRTTFSGLPKPLHLQDNWDAFAKFHHQIIHRVVIDTVPTRLIWDHEDFFRNSMLYEVFPSLIGTQQEAYDGDVLVVSDMDEVVRPGAMLVMRHCDVPERLSLRTDFYYYSFQWRHRGPQWTHPDATIFRGIEATLSPNHLRHDLVGPGWLPLAALRRWKHRATLSNAGWHCSSCFASVAEMRTKMSSFAHQTYNTPTNRDAHVMMDRVRHGLDLFGRPDEIYDRVAENWDVPAYIMQQYRDAGRFKYLLDRDGEDAGFVDWESIFVEDGSANGQITPVAAWHHHHHGVHHHL